MASKQTEGVQTESSVHAPTLTSSGRLLDGESFGPLRMVMGTWHAGGEPVGDSLGR